MIIKVKPGEKKMKKISSCKIVFICLSLFLIYQKTEAKIQRKNVINLIPGYSWGAFESIDTMTGEKSRYIVMRDSRGETSLHISQDNETKCFLVIFNFENPMGYSKSLDSDRCPIFKIDIYKAIKVSSRKIKKYDRDSWMWFIGDWNKEEMKKIISQFKKGQKLTLRYYLYPKGYEEIVYPLKGFTKAFNWLTK